VARSYDSPVHRPESRRRQRHAPGTQTTSVHAASFAGARPPIGCAAAAVD
jgi:hypothetical protein